MNRLASKLVAALALCACLTRSTAAAKELDQFTDRLLVLHYYAGGFRELPRAPGPEQVDAVLDARMNELLDALARSLEDDPPENAHERDERARETFQHRYLPQLMTPYEEWVKHDAYVPLYTVRDKGIYGNAVDYDDMRMAWYIELSPIIQVAGVLIGLDKLGHFLGQGSNYHARYRAIGAVPEAERLRAIRELGHRQELGQLGIATGGVYSFADLAANWAGMTFLLALFDDVAIEGDSHARYFDRTPDGPYRRVRDFHWSEWITSDWDEVLNPAVLPERALFDKVSANMRASICEHYRADPEAFLGARRGLIPRSRYALPERAATVASYALDIRAICRPSPRRQHDRRVVRGVARDRRPDAPGAHPHAAAYVAEQPVVHDGRRRQVHERKE